MSQRINAGELQGTIRQIMNEYSKATYMDIKNATDKTAKETVKNTKAKAPVKTGEYKKGWGFTRNDERMDFYSVTVHEKKRPSLTHLLQNGHGGPRPAKAYPHIQQDEDTQRIFEENLVKELNS